MIGFIGAGLLSHGMARTRTASPSASAHKDMRYLASMANEPGAWAWSNPLQTQVKKQLRRDGGSRTG